MPGPDQLRQMQEQAFPPEKRAEMFGALVNEDRAVPVETKQRRTVYVRFSTDIEVEANEDPTGLVAGGMVYKARSVDFPDVWASGTSQEGALVECERRLNEHVAAMTKGSA